MDAKLANEWEEIAHIKALRESFSKGSMKISGREFKDRDNNVRPKYLTQWCLKENYDDYVDIGGSH